MTVISWQRDRQRHRERRESVGESMGGDLEKGDSSKEKEAAKLNAVLNFNLMLMHFSTVSSVNIKIIFLNTTLSFHSPKNTCCITDIVGLTCTSLTLPSGPSSHKSLSSVSKATPSSLKQHSGVQFHFLLEAMARQAKPIAGKAPAEMYLLPLRTFHSKGVQSLFGRSAATN